MRFTRTVACAAILAFGVPFIALAQEQGPPQLQQAREDAKTAALNDLSTDHRAQVQTIAQQVRSGSLSMADGAKQIDGLLSKTETQAVLDEQQKMRDAMRQAFSGSGGMGGFGGTGHFGGHSTPDAGQFLLTLITGMRPQ